MYIYMRYVEHVCLQKRVELRGTLYTVHCVEEIFNNSNIVVETITLC